MNQIPPAGTAGPQQTDMTSARQVVETPVERYFFSRWMVKIVDAIACLFGFNSPFAHAGSAPEQSALEKRTSSIPSQTDQPKASISDRSSSSRKPETAKTGHKPIQQEAIGLKEHNGSTQLASYKKQRKAVRQKPQNIESRSDQERRKKRERKQRRHEERHELYAEQQSEPVNAVRSGPKSHKAQRMERKAAQRAEQEAIRADIQSLMAIDYFTEEELAEQKQAKQLREKVVAQHQEALEIKRLSKLYDDVFASEQAEEAVPVVDTTSQDIRSIRIPDADLSVKVGGDDYQQRVADLYQRLSVATDDKGEPLSGLSPLEGKEAFQVCFAPVLVDPGVDLDEVVEAFVNFKRLQSIESLIEGVRFPNASFGLLFDQGALETDPLAFEDVIAGPADMEPGFKSVAENNQFYRINQYKDLVSNLFEDIEIDLIQREIQLADLEAEQLNSKGDSAESLESGYTTPTPDQAAEAEQMDSLLSEAANRLEQTKESQPDSGIGTGDQTPDDEFIDESFAQSSETLSKAADKLQMIIQQSRTGTVRQKGDDHSVGEEIF